MGLSLCRFGLVAILPLYTLSDCSHCVVNQTLQIRHVGYRSAVAVSSPMVQITFHMPISNVRYQYCFGTIADHSVWCGGWWVL